MFEVRTVDDANKANQRAVQYWFRVQFALRKGEMDVDSLNVLTNLVPPGLYEHFKSRENDQKFYLVFGVVPDVNGTFDPVVHYTALYGPLAGKPAGRSLFDPDDGFWGPIVRPGDPEYPYEGPRFRLSRTFDARQIGFLHREAIGLARCKTRHGLIDSVGRLLIASELR